MIHARDTQQLIEIARIREWRLRHPQSYGELRINLQIPVKTAARVLERGGWATAEELDVIHWAQKTLNAIHEAAPNVYLIDCLQDIVDLLNAADAASPTIPAPSPDVAVPEYDLALSLARWGHVMEVEA